MKFSVLLPTRNRLDLLKSAIETVRRQDYSDWEIIVSDNFSDEDIIGYVQSLDDVRIKFHRTEKFIPVTDNWNNALLHSNGTYVIMLGDDDCLMQGYFSKLSKLIKMHGAPELIYTSAFLYAYPGVMPNCPDGFLYTYNNREIFRSVGEPFKLRKEEATELVKLSTDFRMRFDYNMQFSLVSRKLIRRMATYGSFYQSPYPDYYASNALMLKAESVLVVPQPLVAIGISPKSFGFYYFNDLEQKGNEFLKNTPDEQMIQRLRRIILPGTDMNTSWLLSMETLAANFETEENINVNYDRYRLLQICSVFSTIIGNSQSNNLAAQELRKKMTLREWMLYGIPLCLATSIALIVPSRYRTYLARRLIALTGSHPKFTAKKIDGKFRTILDVFEKASV